MKSVAHGSRRLVVGAHYGLRDWMGQRATALLLALYTLTLLAQLVFGAPVDYDKWSGIFAGNAMKAFTFVAIVSLLWHAWVGMRDIWMDYVKPVSVRLALQLLSAAWLVGCSGWALQVLWRL